MQDIMNFPNVFGDGVHDDTSGIQAALNTAKDIYFGSSDKTFLVSDSLKLNDHHQLVAQGATIIQKALQKSIFDFSVADAGLAKKNISITGFTFIGCQNERYNKLLKSNSEAKAIKCDYARNTVIRDNNFKNFMYSPLMANDVDNFLFASNVCFGFDSWDNWLPPNTSINDIEPRDNTAITIGGNNIKILDNTISNTSQGIFVILGSTKVIIRSNFISRTLYEHGIYADSGVSDLLISDNIISDIMHTGIKVQNYDRTESEINVTYVNSKNITISNNSVSNAKADGILVLNSYPENPPRIYAQNVSITGNNVSGVNANGINVRCAKYGTVGNNIINQNLVGIYIDNVKFTTINNNVITDSQENGIYDQGTGEEILYVNNYINDSGKKGNTTDDKKSNMFLINGSNRYVVGNVAKKSSTHNLAIESGELETWEIRNNSFLNSEYNSIRIIANVNSQNFRYFGENILKNKAGNTEIALPNNSQLFNSPQLGNQDMYFSKIAPPSSPGNYKKGTIIINSNPIPGGFIGWVSTGTTWKLFGKIEN